MARMYNCCSCGHALEEKEAGLRFVGINDAGIPIYKKFYAYYCPICNKFQQTNNAAPDTFKV